jgi:general nucleoside transport system permease protein
MNTVVVLGAIDWGSISPVLLLASMLRFAAPLTFVALGETFSQRAGVINIGIEGVMLAGCCIAAAVSYNTGSVLAGFLGAIVGGMVVMALVAFLVLTLQARQIVIGVGVNLAALGLTTIAVKNVPSLNSVEGLRRWDLPGLADLPVLGKMMFQQKAQVYLMVPVAIACSLLMNRTAWGLRVKAAGETPAAADAAGIVVNRIRLQAMLLCGALAGLGGAALALGSVSGFTENMVTGQGFIALVAVIFGRWRPAGVVAGCLTFAFFEAVVANATAWGVDFPSQLLNSVPFVASLAALVLLRKGANPPSALSLPFERKR